MRNHHISFAEVLRNKGQPFKEATGREQSVRDREQSVRDQSVREQSVREQLSLNEYFKCYEQNPDDDYRLSYSNMKVSQRRPPLIASKFDRNEDQFDSWIQRQSQVNKQNIMKQEQRFATALPAKDKFNAGLSRDSSNGLMSKNSSKAYIGRDNSKGFLGRDNALTPNENYNGFSERDTSNSKIRKPQIGKPALLTRLLFSKQPSEEEQPQTQMPYFQAAPQIKDAKPLPKKFAATLKQQQMEQSKDICDEVLHQNKHQLQQKQRNVLDYQFQHHDKQEPRVFQIDVPLQQSEVHTINLHDFKFKAKQTIYGEIQEIAKQIIKDKMENEDSLLIQEDKGTSFLSRKGSEQNIQKRKQRQSNQKNQQEEFNLQEYEKMDNERREEQERDERKRSQQRKQYERKKNDVKNVISECLRIMNSNTDQDHKTEQSFHNQGVGYSFAINSPDMGDSNVHPISNIEHIQSEVCSNMNDQIDAIPTFPNQEIQQNVQNNTIYPFKFQHKDSYQKLNNFYPKQTNNNEEGQLKQINNFDSNKRYEYASQSQNSKNQGRNYEKNYENRRKQQKQILTPIEQYVDEITPKLNMLPIYSHSSINQKKEQNIYLKTDNNNQHKELKSPYLPYSSPPLPYKQNNDQLSSRKTPIFTFQGSNCIKENISQKPEPINPAKDVQSQKSSASKQPSPSYQYHPLRITRLQSAKKIQFVQKPIDFRQQMDAKITESNENSFTNRLLNFVSENHALPSSNKLIPSFQSQTPKTIAQAKQSIHRQKQLYNATNQNTNQHGKKQDTVLGINNIDMASTESMITQYPIYKLTPNITQTNLNKKPKQFLRGLEVKESIYVDDKQTEEKIQREPLLKYKKAFAAKVGQDLSYPMRMEKMIKKECVSEAQSDFKFDLDF